MVRLETRKFGSLPSNLTLPGTTSWHKPPMTPAWLDSPLHWLLC
ncbi:hypothetical protein FOYG_14795 [Fusarium oxysporum NRRL 32931]|uniref:Uncharacterized protein n=1 Tax=Fusarium oxysporum NRRL 32931 TaxID=660029 RepID=W9HR43_FUSOX|nr:hypothetical protein FOYG_14795 [Fusarium oxysporum NRRL 32931]